MDISLIYELSSKPSCAENFIDVTPSRFLIRQHPSGLFVSGLRWMWSGQELCCNCYLRAIMCVHVDVLVACSKLPVDDVWGVLLFIASCPCGAEVIMDPLELVQKGANLW